MSVNVMTGAFDSGLVPVNVVSGVGQPVRVLTIDCSESPPRLLFGVDIVTSGAAVSFSVTKSSSPGGPHLPVGSVSGSLNFVSAISLSGSDPLNPPIGDTVSFLLCTTGCCEIGINAAVQTGQAAGATASIRATGKLQNTARMREGIPMF